MKHRPDTCPECSVLWTGSDARSATYHELATFVWKCRRCGEVCARSDPHDRLMICH